MKKTLIAGTAILGATSFTASAADDLQSFWDESTFDMKVRTAYIKMDPRDVNFEVINYDAATATAILFQSGANEALGSTGTPLDALELIKNDPAAIQAALADPTTLAGINQFIPAALKTGVENEGTIDQSGTGVWAQFESAYFMDMIGFDLGWQGAVAHHKDDVSSKLVISRTDGVNDDGYARLSTARVKFRYGNDEQYVKAHYGRYSDLDENKKLLDTSDEGYGISGHYGDLFASYSAVTASSDNTQSDFTENTPKDETLSAGYNGEYGEATLTREFSDGGITTTKYKAKSGIPMSMLGLNIAEDKMMDYLLVGQVDYGSQSDGGDATQYEVMLAAVMDGVSIAASYNNASDDGNADVYNLVDKALINDTAQAGQTTTTLVANIDGKKFNLPGLSFTAFYLSGKIEDLSQTDGPYSLTGKDSFTESIFDTSYTFQEGSALEGFKIRGVVGGETNQASTNGYGLFIDYDLSF